MMSEMKLHALLPVAAVLAISACAADEWHTDFAAARARAQAENKPILLDFTGSDWCGWCITMRRQVLDTPEFKAYARDKFVLMEVDLPRNTAKLTPQQLQQNRELVNRYRVDTFPTVLVITPGGDITGGFTGGRTDLGSVTQPLELAFENARLLEQAATQSGEAKARTLSTFYWNMPAVFRRNLSELRKEIAALDPQNTTGIHAEQRDLDIVHEVTAQTRGMSDESAIIVISDALPTVSEANRSDLLQLLAERLNSRIRRTREQADSLDDIESMRHDNLLFIKYCVPKASQPYAIKQVDAEFCNPPELLEQLRRERQERRQYKK